MSAHVAIHAAAVAVANATRASGPIAEVSAGDFMTVLTHAVSPMVLVAEAGMFRKRYRYLMSYKGVAFYTQSKQPLILPNRTELVRLGKLSIPQL
ncbi:MAG: hypothetical protein ABR543_07695 [Gemmatimonadaceae bacterium]